MAYLAALSSWSMDWAWSEIVNFMAVTTMVLFIAEREFKESTLTTFFPYRTEILPFRLSPSSSPSPTAIASFCCSYDLADM